MSYKYTAKVLGGYSLEVLTLKGCRMSKHNHATIKSINHLHTQTFKLLQFKGHLFPVVHDSP